MQTFRSSFYEAKCLIYFLSSWFLYLHAVQRMQIAPRRLLTSFSNILQVQPLPSAAGLPKPEQWLGSITGSVPSPVPQQVPASPRRAPPLHARAHSLGSAAMSQASRGGPSDPFDVEWAEIAARNLRQSTTTNPFIMPNTTQAFQVQL